LLGAQDEKLDPIDFGSNWLPDRSWAALLRRPMPVVIFDRDLGKKRLGWSGCRLPPNVTESDTYGILT
jgi:hypothetical protein